MAAEVRGGVAHSEPALQFWLDYVESQGAVTENTRDSVLTLLPPVLQERFHLPEELLVTSDADVAREDGALLIIPGQAVVDSAASTVLDSGDVGVMHQPWPNAKQPARESLQEAARAQVAVDHGRIDLDGQPTPMYLPVLRLGAVVQYSISIESRFQETAEAWVDARTGIPLGRELQRVVSTRAALPGPGTAHPRMASNLERALQGALRALDESAALRRSELEQQARSGRDDELARVTAYYEAALASIASRRASAAPERHNLYDAQAAATRDERTRRLAETHEKFTAVHEIRPFRLHIIEVPVLVVPVLVRRGHREFRHALEWWLPGSAFAMNRCPKCGSSATLLAGRDELGCQSCIGHHEPTRHELVHPDDPADPEPKARSDVVNPDAIATPAPVPTTAPAGNATSGTGALDPRAWARLKLEAPEIGKRLAVSFWRSAASLERWPRLSTVPHSPLEATYRLFGPEGPLRVVGVPPGHPVRWLSEMTTLGAPGEAVTSGTLQLPRIKLPYSLRWRFIASKPAISEVLPFLDAVGTHLPPRGRIHREAASLLAEGTPIPDLLGEVEAELWNTLDRHGLAFVIRCLSAFWRVQGKRELRGVDPPVLAAAISVACGRRSGLRISTRGAAGQHDVPEASVTSVTEIVEHLLGALGQRLW